MARFDGLAWQPVGNATYANLGVPAVYTALSDGTDLYVGGEFTAINGVAVSHVARWDGSVWVWGYGGPGQLGLGTTWNRTTPTQVPGLSGISQS